LIFVFIAQYPMAFDRPFVLFSLFYLDCLIVSFILYYVFFVLKTDIKIIITNTSKYIKK
jgi:hypothetical protein